MQPLENLSGISGIGLLALNSKRESQVSLLADDSPESLRSYTDDRHWSWSALRNTFQLHDLQDLFKSYARRIRNAYFNVYLLLQMGISLATIIGLTAVNCQKETGFQPAVPEVSVHIFIFCCCLATFCATFNETLFKTAPWTQVMLSCFIVLLILSCDIGLTLHFYITYGQVRTASAFQTLIIIYFFLPLPHKLQHLFLGLLVSFSHLILSSTLLYKTPNHLNRVAADAVYYACGNLVGIYAQMMCEVSIRRAFLDRRGYLQSTIRKTFEQGQEEHLLLSILPRHIASQVKPGLLSALQEIEESELAEKKPRSRNRRWKSRTTRLRYGVLHKKPFSDLFVQYHEDVSILYADIVNFTPLTVTLSAHALVTTLNELFGRFDQAAQKHNCLRIKLIGDCYYCVSGLPIPTPRHATNCVLLGLDMIHIIRDIRAKLKVDVAMRIGVHSGSVISGIVGIYKWHFDIWSRDTLIANRLEQTGKPGRVHVTKQTRDLLQKDLDAPPFHFTPERAEMRDKYLAQNKVETFLLVPPSKAPPLRRRRTRNSNSFTSICSEDAEEEANGDIQELPRNGIDSEGKMTFSRRGSTPTWLGRRMSANILSSKNSAEAVVRRKSFLRRATDVTGENLATLRKMLSRVNEEMAKAIEEMPLRKADQWCGGNHSFGEPINPVFISFYSWRSEVRYQTQPDPLFKFYLTSAFFVLLCIGVIQALILPSAHDVLWVAFSLALFFLLILMPFVWASYLWNRLRDPHRELDEVPEPKHTVVRFLCNVSNAISNTWSHRVLIYFIVALILSTFAIIDVVDCRNDDGSSVDCGNPWYFTYSCTLAILGIHGFFRIHFLIKLLLTGASLTAYALTMYRIRTDIFANDSSASPAVPPEASHVIYLVKIVLLLHILDRQMEYINRLDFLWKKRLTDEYHAATRSHELNSILIHNILPPLVARIYLDPGRTEVHSKSYTDVAVMFASIPSFVDFYTENDFHEHGIRCIQLLNEIIVEFDQSLVNFLEVEKIKVIGSTYMAAAGLQVRDTRKHSDPITGKRRSTAYQDYVRVRNDSSSSGADTTVPDISRRRSSLLSLVSYASTLMKALRGINKDAFQNFQLRIGLDAGPVVAGVIGTSKPLYDIWGDTVNMASRMESTGMVDKIQVGQRSATLLQEAGVECIFRDRIRVKGKHQLIPTYTVHLNSDYDVQYATVNNTQQENELETTRL